MSDAPLPQRIRDAIEEKGLVSVSDLAGLLGISSRSVRDLIYSGVLPYHNFSTGKARIRPVFTLSDVQTYWERCAGRPNGRT